MERRNKPRKKHNEAEEDWSGSYRIACVPCLLWFWSCFVGGREGGREGCSKGVTRACNQEEGAQEVYHRQYVNRFVAGIFFRTDYLEEDHRVANLRNLLLHFGEGDGDDLNVCGSKSLVAKEEREEGH